MSKVTLKDVAKRADVSVGTVSRVINNYANVKPGIKKRVDDAIAELGYEPNIFAQGIRGGSSQLIGIIVQDITSFPFANFVQQTQKLLREAKYMLVLAPSYDSKEVEISLLKAFASRKIDGVIMTTCDEEDEELIEARESLEVPVVLLDRKTLQKCEDAVLIDHFSGTLQALRYLLDLGHTRIGLLTGKSSVHPARDRLRAYTSAFGERGLQIDNALIKATSFNSKAAFMEASKLLSLDAPPTAIIAGGTSLLAGLLEAVQIRGLKIPTDISIIGTSDTPLTSLTQPPISIIRWNTDDLGRASAGLLLDRISEKKTGAKSDQNTVYLPSEFLIRSSCSKPI